MAIIESDVQGGPFYTSEKGYQEVPFRPPCQVQLSPKRSVLEKGSSPVTTYESDPETITQCGKMHRDENEDIERETVDRDKRVSSFEGVYRREKKALREGRKLRGCQAGTDSQYSDVSRTWSEVKLSRSDPYRSPLAKCTYDEEYVMLSNSALRAKRRRGSERPLPGKICDSMARRLE